MKKIISFVGCLMLMAVSLLFGACGDGNTLVITEKGYANTVTDVYTNPADYLGKTFIFEGKKKTINYNGKAFNIVRRYSYNCCSQGSEPGFIVIFDEEIEDPVMPDDDAWVKCTGVLKKYKYSNPPASLDEYFSYTNDQLALRVVCTSMEVMETSGRYDLSA